MPSLVHSTKPTVRLSERLALQAQMLITFQKAAKERHKRHEQVPMPGERTLTEAGWVAFERNTMLGAVNAERLIRGLGPVIREMFMRVEQLAVGHSDYSTKLALYCAELAIGEIDIKP
jgi:hypothetical protein